MIVTAFYVCHRLVTALSPPRNGLIEPLSPCHRFLAIFQYTCVRGRMRMHVSTLFWPFWR